MFVSKNTLNAIRDDLNSLDEVQCDLDAKINKIEKYVEGVKNTIGAFCVDRNTKIDELSDLLNLIESKVDDSNELIEHIESKFDSIIKKTNIYNDKNGVCKFFDAVLTNDTLLNAVKRIEELESKLNKKSKKAKNAKSKPKK
jgi:hypothetical protein